MSLKIGDQAPEFTLPNETGKGTSLSDFKGKWVVLYFYPKDLTPGCTVEACSFRDNLNRLASKGAIVLGVSKDSAKSHTKFIKKEALNFPLLSDETGEVCKAYESFGKKKFMGREYEGIMRNTFLINPDGKIAQIYLNVKPAGHVDQILNDL